MFGKRKKSAPPAPEAFRNQERTSGRGMDLYVDGNPCTLLDYSRGGIRIEDNPAITRRVVVIELYRGRTLEERIPAVLAWRRDGEAGYSFRRNLALDDGTEDSNLHPDLRGRNETGAVAGNALRDRLKL